MDAVLVRELFGIGRGMHPNIRYFKIEPGSASDFEFFTDLQTNLEITYNS